MATGSHAATNPPADVVVVGAGPAGCAVAIAAAQAGLKVSMIDAGVTAQYRPGESLHPGCMLIFRQLGVAAEVETAGFLRFPGQYVEWGGLEQFQPFGGTVQEPWLGLQATRRELEAILHQRCLALGVEILTGIRALDVMQTPHRVCGIQTTQGVFPARYVIDAGGGGHWLGRRLGHGVFHASRQLVAFWTHGPNPTADGVPRLVADPTGWSWEAPLANQQKAWVRLPFDGSSPDRMSDAESWRGTDVTWRILPESAGPGYFLVGDAAAVLDPLTSKGVLRAMMSGIMAARCMAEIEKHPGQVAALVQSFREWWLDGFQREVQGLRDLYAKLPDWWRVDLRPEFIDSTIHQQLEV